MIKRLWLPAIASLLILVMVFASVQPAVAEILYAKVMPTLEVSTIAEDDEVRQMGVIVLGLIPSALWAAAPGDRDKRVDDDCMQLIDADMDGIPTWTNVCIDKLSQHKILVTFNGVPVTFQVDCQFVKKEKLHPLQKPQGTYEQLRTVVTDESANFVCKLREGKPGVGVLDVYYIGEQAKQFVADYIMVVSVWTTIGTTVIYGVDVQDVCVLGWALGDVVPNVTGITKPSGDHHYSWENPLGPFVSCEELALWQRDDQGLPLLYD